MVEIVLRFRRSAAAPSLRRHDETRPVNCLMLCDRITTAEFGMGVTEVGAGVAVRLIADTDVVAQDTTARDLGFDIVIIDQETRGLDLALAIAGDALDPTGNVGRKVW